MKKYRGHFIENSFGEYRYCDTGEPIRKFKTRPCGHCDKPNTTEGYDGCLGKLPGVMNACCGHGNIDEAYVQLLDGKSIHGHRAVMMQNLLKEMI